MQANARLAGKVVGGWGIRPAEAPMTPDLSTAILTFSHGPAQFTRAGFARFRHTLAAAVGIDLGEMEMFGGRVPWEMVADPLVPLLRASDVAGRVAALRCGLVATRLRSVLTEHPAVRTALGVIEADGVLAGLEAAAAANEPFEIHG